MADSSAKTIKIPEDIEYRVISSFFGLLIASAGLFGGTMLHERSFEYWADDLVPLLLAAYMAFRLFRTFIATMTLYQDTPHRPQRRQVHRIHPEQPGQGGMAQLPEVPGLTSDQVAAEVARRIEAKKSAAQKKQKGAGN